MLSLSTAVLLLVSLYYGSYLVRLVKNYREAQKSGLPIIVCPLDPEHPLVMMISVPLRPYLERYLPERLFSRLTLGIYGWGYHENRKPFVRINSLSFMLVTFGINQLWTIDPEVVAEIIKSPTDFPRHKVGNFVLNMFGPSSLTSEGEDWVRQRKLITSVINERISKVVFDETWKQSQEMLADIEESSSNNPGRELKKTESGVGSVYANAFPAMKTIAANVLFRSAYGAPQDFKQSPKTHHSDSPQGSNFQLNMVDCIYTVVCNLAPAALLPSKLLSNWPSFLPGAQWARGLGAAKDQFPIHLEHELNYEREALSKLADGESRSNLMSMMLRAVEHGEGRGAADAKGSDGKQQPVLSHEELRGNLFIFTTAGFETTATALTFALLSLMVEPKWQDWLFQEIDLLFDQAKKEGNADSEIDYVAFYPKAKRCLALMMETLRLYSPIVQLARETTDEPGLTPIKTSTNTYHVPTNTHVYSSMLGLHTDPQVWRNLNMPDDSHTAKTPVSTKFLETMQDALEMQQDEYVFRPARWEELKQMPDGTMTISLFQPPKGSFIPFLGGPRVCPGQKMAQVEFVCVILALFKDYRIEVAKAPGETNEQVQQRLKGILRDCHAELTLVMERLHEVEVKFIKRFD